MFLKVFFIILRQFLLIGLLLCGGGLIATCGAFLYLSPKLPGVDGLKEVKLQTPLKVYTHDDRFIAQFGEKYRIPVTYTQVPDLFVKAILAAEDDRFFSHPGIDVTSLARAAFELIKQGHIKSGGSTITMQVARNYFLNSEKKFVRKFNEILLAFRIEQTLSKEEILQLYFNTIYMGNRSYGLAAAAKRYYGKELNDLTLSQIATLAGLPKAPSENNPIKNPEGALIRRNWILSRMLSLGYISNFSYEKAIQEKINAHLYDEPAEVDAAHVAEMVRDDIYTKYKEQEYNSGWRIYTTIESNLQDFANNAIVNGLINYEQRHEYRGPIGHEEISKNLSNKSLSRLIIKYPAYQDLYPAIISEINKSEIKAVLKDNNEVTIYWNNMKWAASFNKNQKIISTKPSDLFKKGDVIYVKNKSNQYWLLTQIPQVEGALISLDANNGAIKALVGGFSFNQSKFNRATQALRQAGSNFKPFIYSAALNHGFLPSSIVEDAPLELTGGNGHPWKPQNSDGKFLGPIRLREALYKSRNLVSIRLLQSISIPTTIDYIARFGFEKSNIPNEFSLALGTASVTPLSIATGYAAFANGGYKISPYFIDRIIDLNKNEFFHEAPATVIDYCDGKAPCSLRQKNILPIKNIAPRIIEARNAYMMNNMLSDVIRLGTATKAKSLGRSDLAGKTGTTNDQKDNWFSGFNRDLVTTVWVGFDNPKSLGSKEFGATTALPIWMEYMEQALQNQPEKIMPQPEGLTMAKIDPLTGLLSSANQPNAIFELFPNEDIAALQATISDTSSAPTNAEEQAPLSPADLY